MYSIPYLSHGEPDRLARNYPPSFIHNGQHVYWAIPSQPLTSRTFSFSHPALEYDHHRLQDYGRQPFVINIEEAAERNRAFRTALWTGTHLQVTLMSLNVGEDIGLEIHPDTDQFLRIEEGYGVVVMGKSREQMDVRVNVAEDSAIFIPAGTWHNLINVGNRPLKLYSIYAPPEHPFGTVHETKADALAAEAGEGR